MINQVQNRQDKKFHNQDLVLWHSRAEQRSFPIPGVVVRQERDSVIIRTCVAGKVEEITVSQDELATR